MFNSSALATLPAEWQHWIRHNLERGCEPGSMLQIMIRDGNFDAWLAQAAIGEATGNPADAPKLRDMPFVDTSVNTVQTPDRTVNVLLAMKSPRIVLFGNVLSGEECDSLLDYCTERLQRSPVVGDADGETQVHAHRTSRGAMLQRGESELVQRIETRLAALVRWPVERGEGLQVLRYERGNEYRPHFDWFNPDLPGPRKHLERGGQRVGTIITYLSDVEEGGATSFPNIGLEVQPRKGCAVFFANTDANGVPDQQTLHAGEPVVRGVKFIATKWLREREYV
jgi:prolyl 4-hydroxylase